MAMPQLATVAEMPDEPLGAVAQAEPSESDIHEKIALLAYTYWTQRGRPLGSPDEDWYRAEAEVVNCNDAAAVAV